MRRYRVNPSGGILLENVAPKPVGPDEVRVRMRAVSLNFRDHLIAQGAYPLPVKADLIPASDGAGEVVEVGSAVKTVRVGDRVATAFFPDWSDGEINPPAVAKSLGGSVDGVLAEEVVLPNNALLPVPDCLTFEQAATLPCAGVTAWNAIEQVGRVAPGDVVLLQGTGGVSTFALQFAKLAGATVIQISSSDKKLEIARSRGADHLINYTVRPAWDVEALRLTGGRGVDLVVEIGGAATLERSIRAVRMGGRIAGIGLAGGLGKIDPLPILTGVVQLTGILVGNHQMYRAMVRAMVISGIEPVIGRIFGFEKATVALDHIVHGESGKIVIRI